MPPVTDFHSVNTVIASICRPSEAATKYSPRTRSAGSARASEISAASAMPAAVADRNPAPSFMATNVAV